MTRNSPLICVGVAGFEPAASSSRTSGAAGRSAVFPSDPVCQSSRSLVAVRGRCCTFTLYLMRLTSCLPWK
jgi:hypothetical protein